MTSETPFHGELEHPRAIERIDHKQLTEVLPRNQETLLVCALPVSAGWAEGLVLDLAHARAVLNIVVRVIQQVESLRLKRKRVAFGEIELACQGEVDLLSPWAVERIQAGQGTRAAAVDA